MWSIINLKLLLEQQDHWLLKIGVVTWSPVNVVFLVVIVPSIFVEDASEWSSHGWIFHLPQALSLHLHVNDIGYCSERDAMQVRVASESLL